jgi:hypothetical protein
MGLSMKLPDEYRADEWGGGQKSSPEKTQEPDEIRDASIDLETLLAKEKAAKAFLEQADAMGAVTRADRAKITDIQAQIAEIFKQQESENPAPNQPKSLLQRLKEAKEDKK